jgi:hypothetical protein
LIPLQYVLKNESKDSGNRVVSVILFRCIPEQKMNPRKQKILQGLLISLYYVLKNESREIQHLTESFGFVVLRTGE